MATFVPANISSGGIDLTKLTNGEQFCIGSLFTWTTVGGGSSPWIYILGQYPTSADLDLSALSAISIDYAINGANSSGASVTFKIQDTSTYKSKTVVIDASPSGWIQGTAILAELDTMLQGQISAVCRNQWGLGYKIGSFTTTDGKVHTADNLNY